MRDSCIIYRSFYEALSELPDDQRLRLYDAIMRYSLDGIAPELTGVDAAVFKLIKPQIDANAKRYENGKKGAEHGVKGGRPKTETPPKPQNNPTETPNVNVNANENVNEEEKEKSSKKEKSVNSLVEQKPVQPAKQQQQDPHFDQFWQAFPRQRRGNRDKARSAWRNALARAGPEEILSGLAAYANSAEVADGFGKGAAAWLNDDRWTHDYGKKRKETYDDVTERVLRRHGAAPQNSADCPPGQAVLFDPGHLRKIEGGSGISHGSDDLGFAGPQHPPDRGSLYAVEEGEYENSDAERYPEIA